MNALIPSLFLASSGETMNPLAFDPAALGLTVATFLGLLLVLRSTAWKPILSAIDAREKRIEDAIRSAEEDRSQARSTLEDYRQRVEGLASEVAEMREKARVEAEAIRSEILAKARSEGESLAEKAQRDIELARTRALEDIRRETVNVGLAIASRVVGRSVDGEDQRRLANSVVAELEHVRQGQ